MELSIYRRTAARIAAAAVYELYPEVEPLGGGETATGFSCDFFFPHPIHTHVIEEKMRAIVQERRPIKILEMVPLSAREYLKSRSLFERSEAVEDSHLVELIQIGEFIDLSEGPHLKNTFDLAAFKIIAEDLGKKIMRITGWCHRSKKELKQFLKILSQYESPKVKGEKLGFWKRNTWFQRGLEERDKLLKFLKKEWFQDALIISGPENVDREILHKQQKSKKVAEVTPLSPHETLIQISFFESEREDWNSYLQMIAKTLTILGFDHSLVSMGTANGFVVVDELSVSHPLISMKKIGKAPKVDFTVKAVVETILLQRIEKNLYDGLS